MTDDTTTQLARIADALELAALIEARKNVLHGHGQTERLNYLSQRIDTLTGYEAYKNGGNK